MPRSVMTLIGLVLLALVVTACGDTPPPSATADDESPAAEESAPEESAEPTEAPPAGEARLATVQERGELICGVNGGLAGFSAPDADGRMVGFDADFCRAIAAAVLGDPDAVEFRELDADSRGPALQTGEVDVLIRNTTWTVSRDTAWGLFAPTTFYDGQGMMVPADSGVSSLDDLGGATICVLSGTTTELNLADAFRSRGIEFSQQVGGDEIYDAYEAGTCNGVTSDRSQLVARRSGFSDPDAHIILDEVMSKEPLGPVAPLGDHEWFNVVKWVVYATIEAEEQGITSDNVVETSETSENPVVQRLLGVNPETGEPFDAGLGLEPDWVVTMIGAVGNYAEIYDRNIGPGTPLNLDRGPNTLWTEGGLLYAPPYR